MVKNYVKELDVGIETAIEAGKLLMKYYNNLNNKIEWKAQRDPVTIADKETELYIRESLKHSFSNDLILGEEGGDIIDRRDKSKRLWIVDPLDGTIDFIEGVEHFVVMIGLVEREETVVGVIYQPVTQNLWYAKTEGGAWKENIRTGVKRRISVSSSEKLEASKLLITRSHHNKFIDMAIELLGVKEWKRIGSVGLKIALVSEGEFDLYVHVTDKTKLWDVAAPEIILKEAGGKITDLAGSPFKYREVYLNNPLGIVASNGKLHQQVLERLKSLRNNFKVKNTTS